jgi:hypothetical protein
MSPRRLTSWEIHEARRVFGDTIDWGKVQIVEAAGWPRLLSSLAARLGRRAAPEHNAVTLGRWITFSRRLHTHPDESPNLRRADLAWLVHELTHVWQFNRFGSGALLRLVRLHLRPKLDPYDYGGAAGLSSGTTAKGLADFTLEQQAEIARDYYARLDSGEETSAWDPLVSSLRFA